jgi:hypothetical protein
VGAEIQREGNLPAQSPKSIWALLCLGLLAAPGCSLSAQYCEKAAECDVPTDPVGNSDDSAAVCTAENETRLEKLRANSEDICHEAAEAWEKFMQCALDEGCDAWEIGESECKDEIGDYLEILSEADNRCEE